MLKAVIFDFGGVLVRTENGAGRRRWEERLGLEPRALEALVFDSEPAVRATRGELPESEVWAHVAHTLGLEADQLQQLQHDFWGGDRLDADLVALIRSLRSRYKTGILSNAWSGARAAFTERFRLDQVVDDILISAEAGLAKPDARIYQLAARRLGVQPEEAVFVDDFAQNVEGAAAAGMRAIHYTAGMDVRAALRAAGVEVAG
jgi:epoxide hydrolase-like predicted phosphatase